MEYKLAYWRAVCEDFAMGGRSTDRRDGREGDRNGASGHCGGRVEAGRLHGESVFSRRES